MSFDTLVTIICLVVFVVSCGVYHYFRENVYLTFVDQRVPQNNTKKKGEKK